MEGEFRHRLNPQLIDWGSERQGLSIRQRQLPH